MRIYSKKLDSSWLKAASIGSLWGSTEVIVGSYLHNLHIPLSGTIMTFFAIILLSIFTYIWNDNWLALKSSLIAALIKSVSPSAVLIGPLTAIIIEGFMFELGLMLFRHTLLGFSFGGALAMISVIIHKIIGLLLFYSAKLIKIAQNFYLFLSHSIGFSHIPPIQALLIAILTYSFLGILAAFIGYRLAQHNLEKIQPTELSEIQEIYKTSKPVYKKTYIGLLIALNITLLVAFLIIIQNASIIFSTLALALFLIVYHYFYPKAFKIFKKPGFWIQLLIILAITTFFYNLNTSFIITKKGFFEALKIVYRALIIIVALSTLSIQLSHNQVKAFILRNGMANPYLTLMLASSTFPIFIDYLSQKFTLRIFKQMINTAIAIVNIYKEKLQFRQVYIVEGPRNGGKTSFILQIAQILYQSGLKIKGIITVKDKHQNDITYYVKDFSSNQKVPLCTTQKIPNPYYKTAKLYFYEAGIKFGNNVLTESTISPLIVVDEVGMLELKDLGWSQSLEILLSMGKLQLWTVRNTYTKKILSKFLINKAVIFSVDQDSPQNAAKIIFKDLFQSTKHYK